MKASTDITTLFIDIGGVLLTDGWALATRTLAAQTFGLDLEELEKLHHQAFDTYELGRLSLDEYLGWVVFHRPRPFTPDQFKAFMFAQSKALPDMLERVRALKARHGLKILVVSNEGRELNAHRIRAFKLDGLVDAFVSSCFVHLRKPDPEIFRLALDLDQTPVDRIVYLENTPMFVRVAEGLGIRSILHTGCQSTFEQFSLLGLT